MSEMNIYGKCPFCGYELSVENSDYGAELREPFEITKSNLLKYHLEASPDCAEMMKINCDSF